MFVEAPPVERSLRTSRLLAGLDDDVLAALGRRSIRRTLARGDFVWRAGEQATQLVVIAAGFVKVVRQMPDGTSSMLAIFGSRESLGDTAVIGRGAYPADAVAASGVVHVVCIDASELLSLMARSTALTQALNRSLIEHNMALHAKIRVMSAGAVERRLATLLMHLAERFGDELEDGTSCVPFPLTRAELASLVGTTVETTIRTMSRWQKAEILATSDDGFRILSPERLGLAASGLV